MRTFVRCLGKAHCREDAQGCRSCGRTRNEIDTTRALVARVSAFILEQDYGNAGEFAAYLAEKVEKKVGHARTDTVEPPPSD